MAYHAIGDAMRMAINLNLRKSWESKLTTPATVAPSTVAVDHYEWRFGDGTLVTTSGNTMTHIYSNAISGRTDVKVTVFPVSGPAVSATTEIDVG